MFLSYYLILISFVIYEYFQFLKIIFKYLVYRVLSFPIIKSNFIFFLY